MFKIKFLISMFFGLLMFLSNSTFGQFSSINQYVFGDQSPPLPISSARNSGRVGVGVGFRSCIGCGIPYWYPPPTSIFPSNEPEKILHIRGVSGYLEDESNEQIAPGNFDEPPVIRFEHNYGYWFNGNLPNNDPLAQNISSGSLFHYDLALNEQIFSIENDNGVALKIYANKKIAIGDVVPTQKLDVDGFIKMRGNGNVTDGMILTSINNDGTLWWTDASAIVQDNSHWELVSGTLHSNYNSTNQLTTIGFDPQNRPSFFPQGGFVHLNRPAFHSLTGNAISSFQDDIFITTDQSGSSNGTLTISTKTSNDILNRLHLTANGNFFIGNDLSNLTNIHSYTSIENGNLDTRLFVDGGIMAEEIKVKLKNNWPDYVFESNYDLLSLEKTESFIREKKHLPGVPSKEELKNDGVNLLEMNKVLLQKIEELFLHTIELEKQINDLKK